MVTLDPSVLVTLMLQNNTTFEAVGNAVSRLCLFPSLVRAVLLAAAIHVIRVMDQRGRFQICVAFA